MEAVIFLSTVTFIVAVGSALVQGVAFWKRYRVRLHVTSKAVPSPQSVDLEALEALEADHAVIQQPPLLHHHSRLGSRNSRWTGYPERRFQPTRGVSDYQFAPYRIVEEPESGTVNLRPPHSAPVLPATFLPAPATAIPATAILQPEAPTPAD